MWVGWRRLSTESAGVGEKRLWLTGLLAANDGIPSRQYAVIGCKLKQNDNEGCNSCASLAGLVLSFIGCFILLVIAPLLGEAARTICKLVYSSSLKWKQTNDITAMFNVQPLTHNTKQSSANITTTDNRYRHTYHIYDIQQRRERVADNVACQG